MVSFQKKLAKGLVARGIEVCFRLEDIPYHSVLVVGGTRQLSGLAQARRRGALIVQRLDGMNWLHRVRARRGSSKPGVRHYVRAEYGNLILSLIRRRLAHRIVYQSAFSHSWWDRVYGPSGKPDRVVYNGVDLAQFSPGGERCPPEQGVRLLLVEGSLLGGYEIGLESAVELGETLAGLLRQERGKANQDVEIQVAGRVSEETRNLWDRRTQAKGGFRIHWLGLVPQDKIPQIDRSAHLLYSADINAACPNSVIEALACGLPVLAFDTGALPEIVQHGAGKIVPYGGDPWQLDHPAVPSLAGAALEMLQALGGYRQNARAWAEAAFNLDEMVDRYIEVLDLSN
jgi:glycosyltransferase involved in cell wall biosynthesis